MNLVTLSLISHTNVGKTTLARTLLRTDVGEVLDQAHVTEVSEAYDLVKTKEACLRLWDTPGLGDSARLVGRLQKEGNPLGWFLHQVWDRYRDRSLFCSQQAVRNIQREADVVLYLVNTSEEPEEAGYVPHEMELLGWIGKPVLVLLNQTGIAGSERDEAAFQQWTAAVKPWPIVRDVLPLDAFTRCWVQEGVLLERVAGIIDGEPHETMQDLASAWERGNLSIFERACSQVGRYVLTAALDRETLTGQGLGQTEKRRAMRVLAQRLDDTTRRLMDSLIADHGLVGRYQTDARERLEQDFDSPGEKAWTSGRAGVLGAAMGGAAGGLVADVAVAGLSFGGGAVAGALLGAAGAMGLRRGFQFVRAEQTPEVRWAAEFLDQLLRQSLLRYLAVAHFGRGRGEWRETGNPERWNALVEAAISGAGDQFSELTTRLRGAGEEPPGMEDQFSTYVRHVLTEVLSTAYPQAAHILRTTQSAANSGENS
ncbi:MAG: GTPase domain-containing protein [Candidatus Binatia bacterium]|nr:GTPase domain-containing protein [Candidatus Binatia bacterium]